MREIGFISSRKLAERFANMALSQDVETHLRPGGKEDDWEVWVLAEDRINKGKKLLSEFKKDPDNQNYLEKAALGITLKREEQKEEIKLQKKQKKVREKVMQNTTAGWGKTIVGLVAICSLLHILREPLGNSILALLSYSQYVTPYFFEIRGGQFWRIFTPMLLHDNWLHLLFNMLWLFQLGGMVERDKGSGYTLRLVLLFGATANTAQYLVSGGNFLGMSGVVYGFFGFVWMKNWFESNNNYFLSTFTMAFLLGLYVVFSFGLLGGVRIANTNHGVGLGTGMICGFLSTGYIKNFKSIKNLTLKEILMGFFPFFLASIGIIGDLVRYQP